VIGEEVALDCLRVFLETPFEGGRHARRVDKLSPTAEKRRAPAQPSERHVSPMTSTARHLPNQQGFFDTALADSDPSSSRRSARKSGVSAIPSS